MGESVSEEGVYNVISKVCHRPSCHCLQGANGRYYARVQSWTAAIELGLRPCVNCRPFFLPTASEELTLAPTAEQQIAANDRRIADIEKKLAQERVSELEEKPAELQHVPNADVLGWKRRISKAVCQLDQTGNRPLNEGLAAQISRLSRQGVIPRSTAAMMRAISEMRNEVEHEFKSLSEAENLAAHATWLALEEWASKEGLQL